jgi:hypothetical protein
VQRRAKKLVIWPLVVTCSSTNRALCNSPSARWPLQCIVQLCMLHIQLLTRCLLPAHPFLCNSCPVLTSTVTQSLSILTSESWQQRSKGVRCWLWCCLCPSLPAHEGAHDAPTSGSAWVCFQSLLGLHLLLCCRLLRPSPAAASCAWVLSLADAACMCSFMTPPVHLMRVV